MNPFVLVVVTMILITGCIEQKASDVKDVNLQVNQTVTGTEPVPTIVQAPEQTPKQTPLIQEESNNTADGTGDQIRDAIAEALENSNPGGSTGK